MMRTYSRYVSVLLVAVILALSLAAVPQRASAQAATAVVNTGALNIRTGPGAGYDRVTSVYRGTTLFLLARNANTSWVRIALPDGRQGWVNAGYIATSYPLWSLPAEGAPQPPPVQTPTATVATGALNLRAGPGIGYQRVVAVPLGTTLTLLARNGAWVKVQAPGGQIGWVNSGYIRTSYPLNNLPVEGAPQPPPYTPPTQPAYRTHVVQPGENLFRISLRYGVNMYGVAALNNIWDVSRIYAGQTLLIPWG